MSTRPLTFGSLFAGIGGLDLGFERAGMKCKWQIENDDYCSCVLERHWPDVTRYGNIAEVTGHELEPVDLICGGFPCQPVSLAGARKGKDDERWLWPQFARIVRVARPRLVLVENVPGLLSHGMGDVLGDLAQLGYDAEWDSIPAAAVGAPHLRFRVFTIARRVRPSRMVDPGRCGRQGHDLQHLQEPPESAPGNPALADADSDQPQGQRGRIPAHRDSPRRADIDDGCQAMADAQIFTERPGLRQSEPAGIRSRRSGDGGQSGAIPDPGRALLQRRQAGAPQTPTQWAAEPAMGRVAHGVPARMDRLRALGNAVVPQVAEYIGHLIISAEGSS